MRIFLLSLLLVNIGTVQAQNLVPNPSFEDYDTCPAYQGQVYYATGWFNPWNTSPDYFNACATDSLFATPYFSTPFNEFGYQWPADGAAYMGIATGNGMVNSTYREAVAAQLQEPLQPGVPVHLAFKASPGGFGSWNGNSAHWTGKGVGLKFFVTIPSVFYTYLYPNSAAIYLDHVLTDTLNWTTVSGTYVPDSAYQYVVVSNFFADSLSDLQVLDTEGILPGSYDFVDQVCSYSPDFCDHWLGLTILKPESDPIIFPNPFSDLFTIRGSASIRALNLSLFDALGRSVWRGVWPLGQRTHTIFLPNLAPGFFTLQTTDFQGAVRFYSVVHVSP